MSWARFAAIVLPVVGISAQALAGPAPAAPASGVPPMSTRSWEEALTEFATFNVKVDALLDKGDFAALNALARSLRANNARFSNGSPKDLNIYASLTLSEEDQTCAPCWRYRNDLSKRWIAATPTASTPYIVRANLLISRADGYRGDGWARDVPPAVWSLIDELIGEAEQLLASKRDIVRDDPQYYSTLIDIAHYSRGARDVHKTLAEGVAAYPGFGQLYERAAIDMLPVWGGSYAALDRLARLAAKNTAATDKTGMFFRVYRIMHGIHHFGFAVDADGVDRPMLLQSMRDVASQYPVDYNYAEFVYMACRIGYDAEARRYAALMKDKMSEWAKPVQALARDCDSVSPRKGRKTAALSIPPV